MGTRSLTIFMEDNSELCRMYRQFDGYPSVHGAELVKLCDVKMVNGFNLNAKKVANGVGCLAAQVIAGLKKGVGGYYMEATGGETDHVDYVYTVSGEEGRAPTIQCAEFGKHVFTGTPKQWKAFIEEWCMRGGAKAESVGGWAADVLFIAGKLQP